MGVFDGFFQNAGQALHNAGQAVGNVAQGIVQTAEQLPGQAVDAVAAPVRDAIGYTRIQLDPQAKAKLDQINNNPKLNNDQKEALGRNLLAKYGGQTSGQESNAQQGSQTLMGMTSPATGANFISGASPFIKPAMGQAADTASNVAQGVAHDFTGPQAQAGFIHIPGGEPPPQAGAILDKNGAPMVSTQEAPPQYNMGSYAFNDRNAPVAKQPARFTNPSMEPNSNPQQPQYATTQEMPSDQNINPSPHFQNGQQAIRNPASQFTPPSEPKPLPKAQFNVVNKVEAPDAAKSVFGSEHTAAIQDALQRNGVQDYSQIAQAAHNLYDSVIKPTLSTTPKLVNIDTVTNAIVSQMQKMKPGLDSVAAKNAAGNVIRDMYDSARGVQGTGVVPTHIDTPSIFSIRQDLNNTDAVKNFYKGNPPLDLEDRATVAARQALSQVLQIAHPNVAQATKDYGLLSDAVPSIYKATGQAAKDAAQAPSFADKYLPNTVLGTQMSPIYKATHDISTNPVGQKLLGGTALVASGVGAKMAYDQLHNGGADLQNAQENQGGTNTPSNSISNTHANSITQVSQNGNTNSGYMNVSDLPQSQDQVKLNGDGTVYVASPAQIKDASGQIIGLDTNSFNKQVKSLNDDIITQQNLIKQNPMNEQVKQIAGSAIAQDQATMDSLKTLHESSAPLNQAYSLVNLITGQTAQALHTLSQTSPNLADLNGYIDELQNNLSPHYSALKQQLSVLSKELGGGNFNVKTKQALVSVLKQVNQQNAYDYYNSINSYIGGSTSPEGISTQGAAPAAAPYIPQGPSSYTPQGQDFSGLMQ